MNVNFLYQQQLQSREQQNIIKGECLAKYVQVVQKLFYQLDCWGPDKAGDWVCDPDSTDRGITGGWTWDLMHSSPVRILIADDYSDPELLADMLMDAAKCVRESLNLMTVFRPTIPDESPADEVPF